VSGEEPHWLEWGRRLQAIAQNGLEWAVTPFDQRRYAEVRRIAAELLSAHSDADPERLTALFAGQAGYATPKVDVRGVVIVHDRVLLVREAEDGRWTPPGGWADVTDSPSEAVVREVAEEAGYLTRATKLLACLDRSRHGAVPMLPWKVYKLFFRCEIVGETPRDHLETLEVGWFAQEALPELSSGRITPSVAALMFAHHRDPARPTDFD
jgi:ADP-ribose pyrophosphatase YjhB (NUDIX family)